MRINVVASLRCLLSLVLAMSFFALPAQTGSEAQIRWRAVVKMDSPDEGSLTIRALVSEGWHLYGTDLPKGGPKPTSFDFTGSVGVEFSGPLAPSRAPVVREDKQFGIKLSQWESNVNFVRKFRVVKGSVPVIKVAIHYMGCSGVTCLPPRTENFVVKVPPYKKK